jgi:protein kinase C substrate 80K-H
MAAAADAKRELQRKLRSAKVKVKQLTKAVAEAEEEGDADRWHVEMMKMQRMKHDHAMKQRLLQTDFGERDVFLPLSSECFSLNVSTDGDKVVGFDLCPFRFAAQKSGDQVTYLGLFSGWSLSDHALAKPALTDTGEAQRLSTQAYTGGEQCWNGPERSTKVTVECYFTNKLLSARENGRCIYEFVFGTPAACE